MSRSLSKKLRFEIFKRDGFVCQYCGNTPPQIVLECDHIIPVSDGGENDPDNLIAACFDCNRGKSNVRLEVAMPSLEERTEMLRERQEQVHAFEEMIREINYEKQCVIDEVVAVYDDVFEGWTLTDSAQRSIRKFLDKLPPSEVIEAMEIACDRMHRNRAFKYFCGVCWRKIKGDG